MIQEIVWLIQNGADYARADGKPNVFRVPFMEFGHRDEFQVFAQLPHPRAMKTHVPYRYLPKSAREMKSKIVYIIRNPKDVMVSYYHFYRMNSDFGNFKGTWNDYFQYFMDQGKLLGYGNHYDHTLGYWQHRHDDNLFIVFYEDIIAKPEHIIRKLADFLGCKLSEECVDRIVQAIRFDVMKENPMTNMYFGPNHNFDHSISPFFRKGKVGDWKNYFTDDQNRIMDEMYEERAKDSGLEFIYEL